MIGKLTCQNEIQAGLFCFVVDVHSSMPRICRRDVNHCLIVSVWRVMDLVIKMPVVIDCADADLANSKSKPIANIVCRLLLEKKTPDHYYAHELNSKSTMGELYGF